MGSHRKRRKLATVQMDRLDFESVSGKTMDENKPFIRWSLTSSRVGDGVRVNTGGKGKVSLVEILKQSMRRIVSKSLQFSICEVYQTQQRSTVECIGKLVYTPKYSVIE